MSNNLPNFNPHINEVSRLDWDVYSVCRPYVRLIEVEIPKAIERLMSLMGISQYKLDRRQNLPYYACVNYAKSMTYQWHITFEWAGKQTVKRLIEIPYVNNKYECIVSGITKIFSNKIRRSNLRFLVNAGDKTALINCINGRYFNLVYTEGQLRIHQVKLDTGLLGFLISAYGVDYALKVCYESSSLKAKKDLTKIMIDGRDYHVGKPRFDVKHDLSEIKCSFAFQPRLYIKNIRRLRAMSGIQDIENRDLYPEDWVAIMQRLVQEDEDSYIFERDNEINKDFVSIGGLLMECIEKSWYSQDPEKAPANAKISDFIDKQLNLAKLKQNIVSCVQSGYFMQILDNINPVASFSHAKKISRLYKGIMGKQNVPQSAREPHPDQMGKRCFISTTEGSAIGLIQHSSLGCIINEFDEQTTPYMRVKNGKIDTSKVIYLRPWEETDRVIADRFGFERSPSMNNIVIARVNTAFKVVEPKDVEYVMVLPGQTLSCMLNLMVRVNNSEIDRMLTAGNMLRQSLILKHPKVSYYASIFSRIAPSWISSMEDINKVNRIYNSSTMAIGYSGNEYYCDLFTDYVASNQKTLIKHKLNPDYASGKSNITSVPYNLDKGCLALGTPIYVAYMMYEGKNFEDSAVVSSELIERESLNSLHLQTIRVPVFNTVNGPEKLTKKILNPGIYDLDKLDNLGVIKSGSYVRTGDILVSKLVPIDYKSLAAEQRLMSSLFGEGEFKVKNSLFRLPEELHGSIVLDTKLIKGGSGKITSKMARLNKLDVIRERFRFAVERILTYHFSDIRQEDRESAIDYLLEGDSQGLAKGLKTSLQKLYPMLESIRNNFNTRIEIGNKSLGKKDHLATIEITLMTDRKLAVGDKITGTHGNKAVISKIENREDMPIDELGRSIELIISPLSVYGRLNYSQITENKIAGLSKELGDWIALQYKIMLRCKKAKVSSSIKTIVNLLGLSISKEADYKAWMKSIHDDGMIIYDLPGDNVEHEKVDAVADEIGFRHMKRLRCGKTGDMILGEIAVGYSCIMKLIHTVGSKFSARSVGSYSIKNDQPIRGKQQIGDLTESLSSGEAQKIGTMEATALMARNMPHFLHQCFSYTSSSKSKNLIKGLIEMKDFVPSEIYNSMMIYLMALGFKLEFDPRSMTASLRTLPSSKISEISSGEIKNPETIHYRTKIGIEGGLFDPAIFGNGKQYMCNCLRYVGKRFENIVCSNCGVKVMSKKTQRRTVGHIKLSYPMVNKKSIGTALCYLMRIDHSDAMKIVAYQKYISVNGTQHTLVDHWSPSPEDNIFAGSKAIRYLIDKIEFHREKKRLEIDKIRCRIGGPDAATQDQATIYTLIDYLDQFANKNELIDSVVIYNLLVLPTDARPLIFSGSGSYMTTELNALYLQIIRTNNQLSKLIDYEFFPVVIENTKALLQLRIDHLLWESSVSESGAISSPIIEFFKGKSGLFRKSVYARRVDFSCRAVITLDQSIPYGKIKVPFKALKKIMLVHIMSRLIETNRSTDMWSSYMMIKNGDLADQEIFDILAYLCKRIPVIINRNPTLHTLGIQGVYAIPTWEGSISVHPYMCDAMGADFDGDTESVYCPIFDECIEEVRSKLFMKSIYNHSTGNLVINPTKELAMGLYMGTVDQTGDVCIACNWHDLESVESFYGHSQRISCSFPWGERATSTPARLIIARAWWDTFGTKPIWDVTDKIDSTVLKKIVRGFWPGKYQDWSTAQFFDQLKSLSNHYGTIVSCSFDSRESVNMLSGDCNDEFMQSVSDLIDGDKLAHSRALSVWNSTLMNSLVSKVKGLEHHRRIVDSGFRGSLLNIFYLYSIRGYVSFTSNYLVPVLSSLHSGFNDIEIGVLSYTRRELITKSIITWVGGYFNRRTVEMLREERITMKSCGDKTGVNVSSMISSPKDLFGRMLARDISTDGISLNAGQLIDGEMAIRLFEISGSNPIYLRSPITCKCESGYCAECYGHDQESFRLSSIGNMVGIRSAQAVSEPITQLLLKTKHKRSLSIAQGTVDFYVVYSGKSNLVSNLCVELGSKRLNLDPKASVITEYGDRFSIPYGAFIPWKEGDRLNLEDILYTRSVKETIYAPARSKIVQDQGHVDLVSESDDILFRIRKYDNIDISQKEWFEPGDEICSTISPASISDVASDFRKINSIMSHGCTGDFNVTCQRNGESVVYRKGEYCICWKGKIIRRLENYEPHMVIEIPGQTFSKGDVMVIGRIGKSPMDLIGEGDIIGAMHTYMHYFKEIYRRHLLSVLMVHMELFLTSFLTYFTKNESSRDKCVRHASIPKEDLSGYSNVLRSLKYPHMHSDNFIDIISYEDVSRILISAALGGMKDNVDSVHSCLLFGLLPPIGDVYNKKLNLVKDGHTTAINSK